MASLPTSQLNASAQATEVEHDFLSTVCLPEQSYGWDLRTAEDELSPDCFLDLDWDATLTEGSQHFFANLEDHWQAIDTATTAAKSHFLGLSKALQTTLQDKVPPAILNHISQQVSHWVQASSQRLDAAVLSVNHLLPQWSLDDLQVFNRPLSYAMRSPQSGFEVALEPLQSKEWDQLSDFEQVRVYLAIANYYAGQQELG